MLQKGSFDKKTANTLTLLTVNQDPYYDSAFVNTFVLELIFLHIHDRVVTDTTKTEQQAQKEDKRTAS